jgi:hypothetical protein
MEITIHQLAEMFSLPSWDAILELNQDNMPFSDDDCDEAYHQAERELFLKWHTGVYHVAEHVLTQHHLDLHTDDESETPEVFTVITTTDWKHSLGKILDTMNGVGDFYHQDIYEYQSVNNYPDPETAAQKSFGWVRYYPAVYGDHVQARFHQAFRH